MQSSASIELSFTVPVICRVVDGKPVCNLKLAQTSATTWTDGKYKLTLDGQYIIIEAVE